MLAAEVRRWDSAARDRFTYESDGQFDTWRSHAAAVLESKPWRGDCDDLVSTVLDLLGRRGAALEHRFRLLVDSGSGKVDHMIGAVLTSDRRFMVVGDTFAPAYGAASGPHRCIAYQRMDEWNEKGEPVWRAGAPWSPSAA